MTPLQKKLNVLPGWSAGLIVHGVVLGGHGFRRNHLRISATEIAKDSTKIAHALCEHPAHWLRVLMSFQFSRVQHPDDGKHGLLVILATLLYVRFFKIATCHRGSWWQEV